MTTLFDTIDILNHHFLLVSHLPPGKAFRKAFDIEDNFGKFFLGLSKEFLRFQVLSKKLSDEININKTNELITDWEKSIGLPDSCFSINVNIDKRRLQILQKFSKFEGVQKKEDFVRVASKFGIDISVLTGKAIGTFPLKFPILFFLDTKSAVHTIFVQLLDILEISNDFALPFPIPFSFRSQNFLQCIFNKLAPANVKVIIMNKGDI